MVMDYVSTGMDYYFSVSDGFSLALGDQNLFWPCFPFLSQDFYKLWHSVMSACLFTEVKQQWVMLILGWLTA